MNAGNKLVLVPGRPFQPGLWPVLKHTTIINYASSVVNKLGALLTDNASVIIYDCHVFIVQVTDVFKALAYQS
jgi:hypothetical protein